MDVVVVVVVDVGKLRERRMGRTGGRDAGEHRLLVRRSGDGGAVRAAARRLPAERAGARRPLRRRPPGRPAARPAQSDPPL